MEKIKQDKEIVVLQDTVKKEVANYSEFKITSEEKLTTALNIRKNLLALTKQVKEKEKSATDPIKAGLKVVQGWFAPMKEAIEAADRHFDIQITKWREAKQKEADEKAKVLEDQVKEGKISMEEAGKKLEKVAQKTEIIPTMKIRAVRILDFAKLPDEYKIADTPKIKKAIQSGVEVAGAELYDEVVNSRR